MKRLALGTQQLLFLQRTIGVSVAKAKTHVHVLGVSGSGKSRYLAHLFLSLRSLGLSATLIDPHGDLSRLILTHLIKRGPVR